MTDPTVPPFTPDQARQVRRIVATAWAIRNDERDRFIANMMEALREGTDYLHVLVGGLVRIVPAIWADKPTKLNVVPPNNLNKDQQEMAKRTVDLIQAIIIGPDVYTPRRFCSPSRISSPTSTTT
jgi:hypothetical protein